MLGLHNAYMLEAHTFTAPQFKAQDLRGLSPAALAEGGRRQKFSSPLHFA